MAVTRCGSDTGEYVGISIVEEPLLVLHLTTMQKFDLFVLAEIPDNDYIKFFGPDFSLKIPGGNIVCKLFYLLI